MSQSHLRLARYVLGFELPLRKAQTRRVQSFFLFTVGLIDNSFSRPPLLCRRRSLSLSVPAAPQPKTLKQPAQAEVYGALCLAYFAFNYFLGRRRNSRLAEEVGESLRPLLEAQFAHVGAGPVSRPDEAAPPSSPPSRQPILLRESPHEFVLWASGRRNLGDRGGSGALFRLKLRPRQDAISTVLAVAEGLPDQLEITLPLPRDNSVPVALAVGRPTALREAVEDYDDLKWLTKPVQPSGAPAKGLPWWPTAAALDPTDSASSASSAAGGGGLAAVSDSVQAFADVVASGPLGPALAASARASLTSSTGRVALSPKPRLRLLRLSGDGALRTRGAGSPILTAVVDLPSLGARDGPGMRDVSRLAAAVLATADAVAAYGGQAAKGTPVGRVMTAEARSKALALRGVASRAAAAGEDPGNSSGEGNNGGSSSSAAAARNLEAKKLAAKEAEKAKLASMSPEAKEKYLLKKQRIEHKRLMKRRTVRG